MTQAQSDALVADAKEAAKKAGGTAAPSNRTTTSLANPGKRENANAVAKTAAEKAGPHNQIAQTPGASIGDSDLSTGQWELDKIRQQTADTRAKKAVEKEMQSAMQAEATEVLHDAVKVDRAADVSAENIAQYDKMAGKITAVSRNIERRFRTIIRDEENDETVSGLPMGSRLEARLLYHRDGKCFSRKNFPRDTPRLAVGYLADESGSMSGIAINASISTGIILEDLCRRMELPCYIGGFTSLVGGLQYISYVEYGSVDAKDKYRLTGMSSCGGTPTGMAIRYMTARLKKLPAANKLLIVSTDGRSADGADALQKIIKEAKKDGVTVVGAGIGASRSAVEKEFGDAFLDVSDMEKMPQLLAGIVKRHLLR